MDEMGGFNMKPYVEGRWYCYYFDSTPRSLL